MTLVAACAPAVASADESALPTAQARAYNADWVPYLDPPEKPAAVCLVDSGVNITPDTPADSPEGPIVKRLALDGGPGTAANSSWEGLHGTRMAFVGAAPINGWGAVGFWPGAQVISIRAMGADQTSFPFDYYSKAVDLCNKRAISEHVVAINLSLACNCSPTSDEVARLDNQIGAAHANDQSIVAAAGNIGATVASPASEPGVLAVAAGDPRTALCSFSNRGAAVDLITPGCDTDLADPISGQLWAAYQSGTSGASMAASVVLALLRSHRPDLDWRAAERLLLASARPSSDGPILDVEALFRMAGLGELVDTAKSRAPAPLPSTEQRVPTQPKGSPSDATAPSDASGVNALARGERAPRLKAVARRRDRITVSVVDLPASGRLLLALQARRSEFGYVTVASTSRLAARASLPLPRRWQGGRLVVRYQVGSRSRGTTPLLYRRIAR